MRPRGMTPRGLRLTRLGRGPISVKRPPWETRGVHRARPGQLINVKRPLPSDGGRLQYVRSRPERCQEVVTGSSRIASQAGPNSLCISTTAIRYRGTIVFSLPRIFPASMMPSFASSFSSSLSLFSVSYPTWT